MSAVLVGPAVRWLGERRAVLTGLLFGAAGFALYGLAPTGALFLVGVPVMSLWGIAGPAMQSQMTRRVAPSEQGQLQGALGSMRGITGMVGPLLFTQVLAAAIAGRGPVRFAGAAYVLAAALVVLSVLLAAFVTRWRGPAPAPSGRGLE